MLLLYTFRSLVLEQHQSIVQEEFPMGKPLYIALLRLLRLLGQKMVHFDKALKCKNKGVSLILWVVLCCFKKCWIPKPKYSKEKNLCKDIYCQITVVVQCTYSIMVKRHPQKLLDKISLRISHFFFFAFSPWKKTFVSLN